MARQASRTCGSFLTPTGRLLMAYLRCTACGSKALIAASQCPRCAQPFNVHDARGERVKLVKCRGCGIMHRHDSLCHWCGERGRGLQIPKQVWRSAAALLLTAGTASAVWNFGPAIRDFGGAIARDVQREVQRDRAADAAERARLVAGSMPASQSTVPTGVSPAVAATQLASAELSAANAVMLSDTAVTGVADGALDLMTAQMDSVQWTPVVARTWVNVRSDASRGGEVVGVIKPASRAMLGTDRAGWRQVRSTEVSGWVDPRLFETDSLRTRGD